MREHIDLPASTNDRISAFFFDFGSIAFVVLINIFMQYALSYKIGVIVLFWLLIIVIPTLFWKGQSVGKRTAHIKVVDLDHRDIPFKTYLIRVLFIYVLGFMTAFGYFVVSYYITTKNTQKRAIHDYVFQTKVIRTDVFVQLTE